MFIFGQLFTVKDIVIGALVILAIIAFAFLLVIISRACERRRLYDEYKNHIVYVYSNHIEMK